MPIECLSLWRSHRMCGIGGSLSPREVGRGSPCGSRAREIKGKHIFLAGNWYFKQMAGNYPRHNTRPGPRVRVTGAGHPVSLTSLHHLQQRLCDDLREKLCTDANYLSRELPTLHFSYVCNVVIELSCYAPAERVPSKCK
jgi:hypothetical protein